MTPRTDPTGEPRTEAGRIFDWLHNHSGHLPVVVAADGDGHFIRCARDDHWIEVAIEAEAAQGAAPLDVDAVAQILKKGNIGCEDHRDLSGGYHLASAHKEDAAFIVAELEGAVPRAEGLPTDEQAEAWLKANDLYAVTHLHEPPPDCDECNASRPSDEPQEEER